MAFLTMPSDRQLVAIRGNSFAVFLRLASRFDLPLLATACHRLQPRGSIKAPSVVANEDDIGPARSFALPSDAG
jgi:hypothetical protein